MRELGNAINESLSDSDSIAEAISEIRKEGYDVFLVLEATIGFNKRETQQAESVTEGSVPPEGGEVPGAVPFTTQDERFLRELRITVDE